jgi:HTH-type transcriptional regulator / antitoxin HipB
MGRPPSVETLPALLPDREHLGGRQVFFPVGNILACGLILFPIGNIWLCHVENLPLGNMRTITTSQEYGALIRQKRKALGLTQDELAERCGVGVRFIVDLESGKPTCQLGKALTAAAEVGLRLEDAPAPGGETLSPPDKDDPLSQVPTFR